MGDKPDEAIIVAGRVGHGDFINGQYLLQNEKMNNRPVYKSDHVIPDSYPDVADKELFLYFHQANDAWVISHEMGTLDVIAYAPSNLKNTWHVNNGRGRFVPDPSVKLIGATAREVLTSVGAWTAEPRGEVALKIASDGPGGEAPMTIYELLESTARKLPEAAAMVSHSYDGTSTTRTYRDVQQEVVLVAKAFVKLGLRQGRSVLIVGSPTAEWAIAHMAASVAGGFGVGVYESSSIDDLHFFADHTAVDLIIVDSGAQLEKVAEIVDRLPEIRGVIQYTGHPDNSLMPDPAILHSWSDIISFGRDALDDSDPARELDSRIHNARPDKCASIAYTQGTSTDPKAVMLSHDNITWTARAFATALDCKAGEDSMLACLPLANQTALMFSVYMPLACGACVHYFPPLDIVNVEDVVRAQMEAKPTVVLSVPYLWARMMELAQSIKKVSPWAARKGRKGSFRLQQGEDVNWKFKYANSTTFSKIKRGLGLDHCRMALSTDYNIDAKVAQYFLSVNLPIFEMYGSTECCGVHLLSRPGNLRPASVGKPLAGLEVRMTHGAHELLLYGRNIMMGYLYDPEGTADAIDERGWFHSRDIAQADRAGFIYVTGRIDDLVKTAAGASVPPYPIETAMINHFEGLFSHVVLVGHKRKNVSLLLVVNTERDSMGRPTDKLAGPALEHVKKAGAAATSLSQCVDGAQSDKIKEYVAAGVEEVNKKAVSDIQQVKHFEFLPRAFTQSDGELGPLFKLKRRFVLHRYAAIVDRMYGHEEVEDYEEAEWYHGPISRSETQALLKRDGGGYDGWFLVRLSTKEKNTFVVSLCFNDKLYHNQVKYSDGVYNTHKDQGNHQYNSLQELINHHKEGKNGFQAKLTQHCKRSR